MAALVAGPGAAPASAQAAGAGQPRTDRTVAVSRGARLTIDCFAGDVAVKAWNREAVRVQARHSARTRVSVRTTAWGIAVSASSERSPERVDYDVSVPAWMPVKVDGTYPSISVEGTQSEVSADTVRGNVTIDGGIGAIAGRSIEGEVTIENANGRITATSVNRGIVVRSSKGDIVAETTKGSIELTAIASASVDAFTVNGRIVFDGRPADRGKYRFSTHNGPILVKVPDTASAAFTVRTYNGSVSTNLPLEGGGDVSRGRRVTFTLGGGSAEFELESFGGTVNLTRQNR